MQLKNSIILWFPVFIILIIIAGCGGGSGGSGDSAGGESVLSDGVSTKSVTISWNAPSTNSDGSIITDLAGYKVHYGPGSGNYTTSLDIGNLTEATISSLSTGTWCFSVTSYDTSGNESNLSDQVCTNI